MTDHLVTYVVETETEEIRYVQTSLRSVAFLAVFYAWELFEFTRIPNLLRRAGKIGPRMTAQQWMVKYPWLWGRPFRAPKGARLPMTKAQARSLINLHNSVLWLGRRHY